MRVRAACLGIAARIVVLVLVAPMSPRAHAKDGVRPTGRDLTVAPPQVTG